MLFESVIFDEKLISDEVQGTHEAVICVGWSHGNVHYEGVSASYCTVLSSRISGRVFLFTG